MTPSISLILVNASGTICTMLNILPTANVLSSHSKLPCFAETLRKFRGYSSRLQHRKFGFMRLVSTPSHPSLCQHPSHSASIRICYQRNFASRVNVWVFVLSVYRGSVSPNPESRCSVSTRYNTKPWLGLFVQFY